jgi:hypothetical protein
MEIILNLAWALVSAGLICFWTRSSVSNPVPRRTQILALLIVVLLLLPVISLSDDLVATQSPAEADSCLRRPLNSHGVHPSIIPLTLALPELLITSLESSGPSQEFLQENSLIPHASFFTRSLDCRPPPRA